jgi:glucosylceramidase
MIGVQVTADGAKWGIAGAKPSVAARRCGQYGRHRRRLATLLKCGPAVFLLFLVACGGDSGGSSLPQSEPALQASVWLTTTDQTQLLAVQEPVTFAPDETLSPQPITIDVDDTKRFQTLHGFGASLTDSSAWLIGTRMSVEQRAELMRRLFDPSTGIGLSTVRHVVGSSDFALSNYTYNDVPAGQTDEPLEHFSIAHEREYILPLLAQARSLNPDLKIIGTPWSAPAWMKTSGSLIGGSLRPESFQTYASYLVRYLQAFAAEGVPITALSSVNEPLFEPPSYPGMLMSASQQTEFVKNNLGPALAAAGLATQIIIYDHNWDRPDYPLQVLNDTAAQAYVTGSAFHCYAGDVSAQTTVHDAHPDKTVLLTECTGLVDSPFERDLPWAMRYLFIGAIRGWATDILAWNLALDEAAGPQNGGCQRCRGVVTIQSDTGAVTYNVEFYALGHASLAARPGAIRIESTTLPGSIQSVAFLNPDASKGLLVFNDAAAGVTFKVRWAGLAFSYTLPAGAVATFRWRRADSSTSGAGGSY